MAEETNQVKSLDEMSAKELQAYLGSLGFAQPEVLQSKAQLIATINAFQAQQDAAKKTIEEAQKEVEKKLEAAGKVVNPGVATDAPVLAPREEKKWKNKAQAMKERLDSQKKVRFLIPLGFGEKRGSFETVIMNGYRLNIMKGVLTLIPLQVAELLAESYQMTAVAGEQFLADRNEEVTEALG